MAEVIDYRFRLRRGLAATWAALDDVLLEGEMGLETDTRKIKIGDGTTGWNGLDYFTAPGGVLSIVPGDGIDVDDTDPANPVVSATGTGGGGSSPWPDGVIMWFSTSHRHGVAGQRIHYLNAPADYQGRGLLAASGGAVYSSSGGVAPGGAFTIAAADRFTTCTIMAVIITPASLTFGTIMAGTSGGALQLRLDNSSGNWHLTLINSGVAGIGDDSGVASLAPSTMYLVTATFDGSTGAWTLRRNGVQTASGTGGSSPTSPNNQIGASGGGETSQHDLLELAAADRVLGSTPLAAAEDFLMTKYSI